MRISLRLQHSQYPIDKMITAAPRTVPCASVSDGASGSGSDDVGNRREGLRATSSASCARGFSPDRKYRRTTGRRRSHDSALLLPIAPHVCRSGCTFPCSMTMTRSAARTVLRRWRDHEGRPPVHRKLHPPANEPFGFRIDRGRRVVEHQDARIGQDRPRDGEPLLLTAGQTAAAFTQHRLILQRQLLDELMRLRPVAPPLPLPRR